MSEEAKMQQQNEQDENDDTVVAYNEIPYAVIAEDIAGAVKDDYYAEAATIVKLYRAYKKGQRFLTEGSNGDYTPSSVRFKKAASILNKEARFLFANPPTFNVNIEDVSEELKDKNTIVQKFLDKVLEKNNFNDKLLKAVKDCFVGKRVALVLNFNSDGITITFLNSLEFIYELSDDGDKLTKIVMYYSTNDTLSKQDQRWFKKKYELEDDIVYVEEKIFNGLGVEQETITTRQRTKFNYIPAVVILNDGLTGERRGESELGYNLGYEGVYSKLANADIDAGRKSMNPIRYTVDASQGSTKGLSSSPGSYWDLQTDDEKAESGRQAQAGVLEPSMAYSEALKTTLDRIENTMYSEIDVPNVNNEKLQGMITSGKTLKALYWGLSVRCDEKMLTWQPALRFMAETIIEGGRLYPNSISQYTLETTLPDIQCDILVENNYPLPEDEAEEKTMDITEVNALVMSKKSYLKKWRKLSDEDADKELQQIKVEQDLFENSILPPTGLEDEEELK